MRLAYFSPLNPQRSGISDYSEELLPHLAAEAEISLFVDGFQPSNREITSPFEILNYRKDPSHLANLRDFDAVVYHMGNDHRYHAGMLDAMKQRAGIVVFHDFALQDFFLGLARDRNDLRLYLNEVELCYGWKAREKAAEFLSRGAPPAIANKPLEFPLNCGIAKSAEGIIVHSAWQAERFARLAPGVPCARINHHITREAAAAAPRTDRPASGPVRIASFGLITPDKGIERALRVLAKLKSVYDFQYTLVGSDSNFPELPQIIARYGLSDRVSVTGHVSLEEFQQWIARADIAICLRERSVGATSGSLCRVMAAGISAIISNVGGFAELPDDAVVKIDHDEYADALLEAYLQRLIEDSGLRDRIGANARAYMVAEHRIEASAAQYLQFIREVIAGRPRRQLVNQIADQMAELDFGASDHAVLGSIAGEVALLAPAAAFVAPNGNDEIRGLSRASSTPDLPVKAEPPGARASRREGTTGEVESRPAGGRLAKVDGIDYRCGAIEYARRLNDELNYYLHTKPFCNLHKPIRYSGDGMDPETHRHFCDFANIAATLALRAEARILDVGCGPGWLSEHFARLGYDVTGIDISDDLIAVARERFARLPYQVDQETPLKCRFLACDIEEAPFPEKFDALICYDALHHFEDEQSVFGNLAAMLNIGGVLFIVEGQKPDAGSDTAEELRRSMREYRILESPFSAKYLRALADAHGFAIVGDYVSVNGLFDREAIAQNQMSLNGVDTNYHYLVCKKVTDHGPASTVPTSRHPGDLRARITGTGLNIGRLSPGEAFEFSIAIENIGDTLWLAGAEPRIGIVMPATLITDEEGALVSEVHGEPVLPRAVAPGETLTLNFERTAPHRSGKYSLKLDLVDQHVCWFEERGSHPLVIEFQVA